jgi:hypothetical protein
MQALQFEVLAKWEHRAYRVCVAEFMDSMSGFIVGMTKELMVSGKDRASNKRVHPPLVSVSNIIYGRTTQHSTLATFWSVVKGQLFRW